MSQKLNRTQLIKSFRSELKWMNTCSFSTDDEKFDGTLNKVLCEVFKDFNFRTLTRKGKDIVPPEVLDDEIKEDKKSKTEFLVDKLKHDDPRDGISFFRKVQGYFEGSAPSSGETFDQFHHELCECFLASINQHNGQKIYDNLHYGKAQKVVNMMFKHLYCLDGAEKYESHFRYCHMALDSFTLEWFKRSHATYTKTSVSYNNLKVSKIPSWSNLEYSENEDIKNEFYTYTYFVSNIPNALKKEYVDYTPFEAEFLIWPKIQLELAAEAFIFEAENMPKEERNDIIAQPFNKKLERVVSATCNYKLNHQ